MFSGTDLINTFQKLGINTGNVNKLTINSWFDSDDKAILEVLNFICANFHEENVLSAQEKEEFEDLLESKNVLYDQEYENGVKEIENDFLGIFDWQSNEIEIRNMQGQIDLLIAEENDLENFITINKTINKNLVKKANQVAKDCANFEVKQKNVEKKCCELSECLDISRRKLHQQLNKYAEKLNEFESSVCPTFLSNVPAKKYEQYVTEVKSCFNLMSNETLTSTIPHLHNSYVFKSTENLEMLRQRIFNSKKSLLHKEIECEQLKAEIQFMNNINVDSLLHASYNANNLQVNFEAVTLSVQMKWEHFILLAEDCLKKVVNDLIDKPKISVIQNSIIGDRKKLQVLNHQDEIITKICSLQKLYYLLLEKENADIKATDTFFREIYQYITKDLSNHESCIKAMLQITQEYETYKTLPVQKKYKILDLLGLFFLNENSKQSPVSAIRNFWQEAESADLKLIAHELYSTDSVIKQLQPQITILQKFLTKGPTTQISIVPYEVYNYLEKISAVVQMQRSSLQATMNSLNNAKNKLDNEKFYKMKRQLWMWFVTNQKECLRCIEQIQIAVKCARKIAS